jgi:hypothetical protein
MEAGMCAVYAHFAVLKIKTSPSRHLTNQATARLWASGNNLFRIMK